MKTFKQLREKLGERRPWKKGWDPTEFKQIQKDKKLKKEVDKYIKMRAGHKDVTVKQAQKQLPYLLKHVNANYGDGNGGDVNDRQFMNAVLFYYKGMWENKESVNEAVGREITLDWDMGDPREYAADWKDVGVYLDHWDPKKHEIEVSGKDMDLQMWLTDEDEGYGMSTKDAAKLIRKGKRVQI